MYRIREDVKLHTLDRGATSISFLIDEKLSYPFQLSTEMVAIVRAIEKADDLAGAQRAYEQATGRAIAEPDLVEALDVLRRADLLEDGRREAEVHASIRNAWRREHEQALVDAVAFAGSTMPLFKKRIGTAVRMFGGRWDKQLFERIPILTRSELRDAYPDGFLPDVQERTRLIESGEFGIAESSGTTGDSRVRVLADTKRSDAVLISGRFLSRHLYPNAGTRQAIFTTLHCSGLGACAADTRNLENRIFIDNNLALIPPAEISSPEMTDLEQTIADIRAHRANWIRANPTYLAYLTWFAIDHGIELPKLNVLTTGYEFPTLLHRRLLSKAWGCPVFSVYGITELQGSAGAECDEGVLHMNDRYFHFELLRDGKPVKPGELGRVVATTLRGRLPIIRYEIGDLGRALEPGFQCKCGSVNSAIMRFAGRGRDTMRSPDGRIIPTIDIDDRVSNVEGIRFYQFIREDQTRYTLNIIPDPSANQRRIYDDARDILRPLLGPDANIEPLFVPTIHHERSGKYRLTYSKIDPVPPMSAAAPRNEKETFALR